jgi:hypothetical protein
MMFGSWVEETGRPVAQRPMEEARPRANAAVGNAPIIVRSEVNQRARLR